MPKVNNKALLQSIPSVDKILNWQEIKAFENKIEHAYLTEIIRYKTDEFRGMLLKGETLESDHLKQMIVDELNYLTHRYFTYAINALGIVLHTGLGRAPYASGICEIVSDVAKAYSRLQIDPEGKRDDRYKKISKLLQILTGAEAGIVVNNNAGATLLILRAIAQGKEVIVSRGQLIEIGGSFRIPDIMAQSGCIMREVGTTNRTHLKDYEQAIKIHHRGTEAQRKNKKKIKVEDSLEPETGAIIRVHQSNYQITGFTKEVSLKELVALGKKYKIPVIDDLGSGALIDFSKYNLPKEPMVKESIQAGADVVCFSGDKLIGGPQAGIIVGKKELIEKIKKHPLTRALRCDKLTNAVLEATLQMFLHKEADLVKEHTVFSILMKPLEEIKKDAEKFAEDLIKEHGDKLSVKVKPGKSEIGGGSLSTKELDTYVVAIMPKDLPQKHRDTEKKSDLGGLTAQTLAKLLRQYKIPIFGRVQADSLILDFRTILVGENEIILQAFKDILK
ncbi:MAG: L-seryl-tRNA(Sec) selenium transferase [Candidatus Latescibacteria bacterium]|nr:L-seryl-tRNA(Sec) selenium transferase [Candidatus Latescibacterota bacterium]